MINDSDIGYTFWDEMWNDKRDETRDNRREKPRPTNTKEDDPKGSR